MARAVNQPHQKLLVLMLWCFLPLRNLILKDTTHRPARNPGSREAMRISTLIRLAAGRYMFVAKRRNLMLISFTS
jgi:hypothetical protein